jgi:hypothetical protein
MAKTGSILLAIDNQKAETLRDISMALVGIGQIPRAIQVLNQARIVAKEIAEPESKITVLQNIAGALVEAGQTSQALQVLAQVQTAAYKLSDGYWKAIDLSVISGTMLKAGQPSQALIIADRISNAEEDTKALALQDIAINMTEAGQVS